MKYRIFDTEEQALDAEAQVSDAIGCAKAKADADWFTSEEMDL